MSIYNYILGVLDNVEDEGLHSVLEALLSEVV
jgi:hypothetical protein